MVLFGLAMDPASINIPALYEQCRSKVSQENTEVYYAHLTILKDLVLERLGVTVSDGGGTGSGAAMLREIYYRQTREGKLPPKQAMQRLERELKDLADLLVKLN